MTKHRAEQQQRADFGQRTEAKLNNSKKSHKSNKSKANRNNNSHNENHTKHSWVKPNTLVQNQ